jgi:hypothetical protein
MILKALIAAVILLVASTSAGDEYFAVGWREALCPPGCNTCPTPGNSQPQPWNAQPSRMQRDTGSGWRSCQPLPDSAIVKIVSSRGKTQKHGSGAIIGSLDGKSLIITVSHILMPDGSIEVRRGDGSTAPAGVLVTDALHDAALLTMAGAPTRTLPLADKPAAPGASVTCQGYAGKTGHGMMAAKIIGYDGDDLVVTGQSPEGSSGGPIHDGKALLGLIAETGKAPGEPWTTKGVQVGWLGRWIAANTQRMAEPAPSMTAASPPAAPAPLEPIGTSAPIPRPSNDPVEVAALRAQFEAWRNEMLAGLKGEPGERGPQGLPGNDGSPGKDIPPALLDEKVGPIRAWIDKREPIIGRLAEDLPALRARIDRLPGAEQIKGVAHEAAAGLLAEKLPAAVSALTPAAATSLTGILLTLGIAAGPAGLTGAAGAWLLTHSVKKGIARLESQLAGRQTSTIPAAARPTSEWIPGAAPVASSFGVVIPIHQDTPPPPQTLVRESTYVPIEIPTVEQEALDWAMDDFVKHYPGAAATVEAIKSGAKQYASGHPRRKQAQ